MQALFVFGVSGMCQPKDLERLVRACRCKSAFLLTHKSGLSHREDEGMPLEFQSMYVCSQAGQINRNCTRLHCIRSLIQKSVLRKRHLVRGAVTLLALLNRMRSLELSGTVSMLSSGLRTVSWSSSLCVGGIAGAPAPRTPWQRKTAGWKDYTQRVIHCGP